ncbi:MAG: hypothetical protein JWN14_4111, partial [Chthonomonadales bacterium]|nr:hypothetical protein [Chthonomonadales bacterium]
RLYRAVLALGTVGLLLTVACGLWLRSYRRQEALNRQLIAALVKNDAQKALALVNAGADSNTPCHPSPPPSLRQLWDWLVRRFALPRAAAPNAFTMACGGVWLESSSIGHMSEADTPQLVQAMLEHGANKNVKDDRGWTPLICSVCADYPETVRVLLQNGADVNAKDLSGDSSLFYAVYKTVNGPGLSNTIIGQLLVHGADPNLPDLNGITPLKLVDQSEHPDLVAHLKQAGAKK